jgi:hypothetical protein
VPSWTITSPQLLTFDTVRVVKAFLIRGSIRVVGTDSGPARLEVSKIDRSPLTVRHDEDGTVEISHGLVNAQRILASMLSLRGRHRVVASLAVPRDCAVEVSSAMAGSLMVSSLAGAVRINSGASDVTLAQLSGPVEVANDSGRLEAMTLSGAVKVNAVSGEVVIADATGSVHAETVSGSLTVDARPRPGAELHLVSVSGPVSLGLPALTGTRVRLETSFGKVSSQFPELAAAAEKRLRLVQETFGTPHTDLWIKTVSGNIAVLRRQASGPGLDTLGAASPGTPTA